MDLSILLPPPPPFFNCHRKKEISNLAVNCSNGNIWLIPYEHIRKKTPPPLRGKSLKGSRKKYKDELTFWLIHLCIVIFILIVALPERKTISKISSSQLWVDKTVLLSVLGVGNQFNYGTTTFKGKGCVITRSP